MRNNGRWTEARFRSFIISALRNASLRWPPKSEVKKAARVSKGRYMCAGYQRSPHEVPVTLPPKPGNKRRINNAVVDHCSPVVDPSTGFIDWNTYIERMFVEADSLQVLCADCHTRKTEREKDDRKKLSSQ